MSGFEYVFVSDVPREYICTICECPMREPVQTKCGHRFCKHCLEQSLKRKRKCPIDRRALDERSKDIYPDVAIERTILDFVVKCPNEQNGCQWTGELRNIETHKSACNFEGVNCTNKGCDAAPLKKDLLKHVTNDCPKRKVECLHCKTSFIWCTRQGHFDVCAKYPMACLQRCGEHKIPRDKMDDHIEHSCQLTKVECTFVHVGCKAKVQRRNISDHVKRNTESHLKLACEKLQQLQSSSILAAASMEEMQSEIVIAMKKITELSEAVLKSGGLQELRDKIAVTNAMLQELQSKEDTNERLIAVQDEVITIKREIKELIRNTPNNEKLLELQDEINKLQKLIPRIDSFQGLWGEIAGTNKKLRKLQEAFASLEKQTNTKLEKLHDAISSLEEQNCNRAIFGNSSVSNQIGDVKYWELRQELQEIRENAQRDRMQRQVRFQFQLDPEFFKNAMLLTGLVIILLVSAFSTTFVRKEELQAYSAKLQQLHDFSLDRTRFLKDEAHCKTAKFVWSFADFDFRFKQAKKGAKHCFFSEPFILKPHGYKLCLAICPNGYPVQYTHLAVFVYLLRSSDDDLLPWPFHQKVIFTLIDQHDDPSRRKNVEATISPKKMSNFEQSAAFAKPRKSTYMNSKGFGFNRFISHSELHRRLYIKDDTIVLHLDVYPLHCDK